QIGCAIEQGGHRQATRVRLRCFVVLSGVNRIDEWGLRRPIDARKREITEAPEFAEQTEFGADAAGSPDTVVESKVAVDKGEVGSTVRRFQKSVLLEI